MMSKIFFLLLVGCAMVMAKPVNQEGDVSNEVGLPKENVEIEVVELEEEELDEIVKSISDTVEGLFNKVHEQLTIQGFEDAFKQIEKLTEEIYEKVQKKKQEKQQHEQIEHQQPEPEVHQEEANQGEEQVPVEGEQEKHEEVQEQNPEGENKQE